MLVRQYKDIPRLMCPRRMCLPCPSPHVLTMHRQSIFRVDHTIPACIPPKQDVECAEKEPMAEKAPDLAIRLHPWLSPRRPLAAAHAGRGKRGGGRGRQGRRGTCLCDAHFRVCELDFPDTDLDVLKLGNDACGHVSDIIVWEPRRAARSTGFPPLTTRHQNIV
jgi:hypothetical protein